MMLIRPMSKSQEPTPVCCNGSMLATIETVIGNSNNTRSKRTPAIKLSWRSSGARSSQLKSNHLLKVMHKSVSVIK